MLKNSKNSGDVRLPSFREGPKKNFRGLKRVVEGVKRPEKHWKQTEKKAETFSGKRAESFKF